MMKLELETPLDRPSVIEMNRLRMRGHDRCLACTHPDLKLHFTLDDPHTRALCNKPWIAKTPTNDLP